jgi:hypothetical protein
VHHLFDVISAIQFVHGGAVHGTEAPCGYDALVPRLACWSCGRQIYTVAPLESLFAEERRCPRCGAFLSAERREQDRRGTIRRQNPADDPGPPAAAGERRHDDRRKARRRRDGEGGGRSGEGWID